LKRSNKKITRKAGCRYDEHIIIMGKNKHKNKAIQEQRRRRQEQRRQFSKKRAKNQYGDSGWKQEFTRFSDQMKVLGLRIKDVAGDGNCLFRCVLLS